jgi:DNA-binding transcriptional regulator YiaG
VKPSELKDIRDELNLTQVQFADALGIHAITLSRFERGVEPITQVVEWAVKGLRAELNGKPKKKGKAK